MRLQELAQQLMEIDSFKLSQMREALNHDIPLSQEQGYYSDKDCRSKNFGMTRKK